jgi:hypothetical protein
MKRFVGSVDAAAPPDIVFLRPGDGSRPRGEVPMLRFKSFSSATCGDDLIKFEQAVNMWLEASQPHIKHMAQSALGEHLILSFVYDDAHGHVAVAQHAVAIPEVFEEELQDTELDPMEVIPLPPAELPY